MSGSDSSLNSRVRLVDIADAVGVSVVTVAKVLNNTGGKNVRVGAATRQRILDYVKDIYYTPNRQAQSLVGVESDLLGVVIDSGAPLAAHARLALIERYASLQGYQIMVAQAHNDPERIKRCVADLKAYGVAGFFSFAHNYPGFAEETAAAFPVDKTVFCDPPALSQATAYVQLNIQQAFCDATLYLASSGRKRIGLLLASGFTATPSQLDREHGWRKALKLANLPVTKPLIGRYSLEDFHSAEDMFPEIERLVKKEKIDALLCNNDQAAFAAQVCLEKLGVEIPDDIALIGCDNTEYAQILGLSSIDDERKKQAQSFVELMIDLLKNDIEEEKKKHIIIKPKLICRKTS